MRISRAVGFLALFFEIHAGAAHGQVLSTWNGGTGDWSNPSKWTPAVVPAGTNDSVVIVAPHSIIFMDVSQDTVFSLFLGARTSLRNLDSLTLDGGQSFSQGVITNSGALTNALGTLTNYGTLNSSATFTNAIGSLNNYGTIANSGSLSNEAASLSNFSRLSNSGSIFNADASINNLGTFTNSGSLLNADSGFSNSGILRNSGTLTVENSDLLNSGKFWNTGTLTNTDVGVTGNSGLFINSGAINNTGVGILSNGGTLFNLGTISVNETSFVTNSGKLINLGTINVGLDLFDANRFDNTGTLINRGTINNGGVFTNSGNVTITKTGTFTTITDYTQTAGSTTVNGALTANSGARVDILGGALNGSGTITGDVRMAGILTPGNASGGTLTILGNYDQTDNGILDELIGPASKSFLSLSGDATLDPGASLDVTVLNGFNPLGKTFSIMDYAALNGQFANGSSFYDDGYLWDVTYGKNQIDVTAVKTPEPDAFSLLAIGLLLLMCARLATAFTGSQSPFQR